MENKRLERMGSEPVFGLIMKMSLPAMFSMVVQALYNIIDSMFVSYIGSYALTAVSLAYPMQFLMIGCSVGTAIGINSLISRRLGEGRNEEASKAATYSIVLGIATWIIFALVGLFFSSSIIGAYTDDPATLEAGTQYLSCVFIFSIGVFIEVNIEKTLQATGNMLFPMLFQLTGAVINIILDPIFIFGWGFIPAYQTLGAAIATVIGQIASMIFAVCILLFKKHSVKVSFKYLKKFDFSIIKDIYLVGIPSIIMQSIGSVMLLGFNGILAGISAVYVNVLGVYYKLQSFVFMPVFGLTHGVMPIMGYNYGAKNKSRLIQALKYGVMIGVVIMAIGVILFRTIPDLLLGIFNADNDMLNIGVPAMRIISLCFIPAAAGILFSTLFQAVGRGFRSLLMSLLRQLGVILPAAYILASIRSSLVWYSFPIAEGVSLCVALLLFLNLYKKDLRYLDKINSPQY